MGTRSSAGKHCSAVFLTTRKLFARTTGAYTNRKRAKSKGDYAHAPRPPQDSPPNHTDKTHKIGSRKSSGASVRGPSSPQNTTTTTTILSLQPCRLEALHLDGVAVLDGRDDGAHELQELEEVPGRRGHMRDGGER